LSVEARRFRRLTAAPQLHGTLNKRLRPRRVRAASMICSSWPGRDLKR